MAIQHRARLQRLLQRGRHLRVERLQQLLVLVVRPGTQADQVLLQPRHRVAEREMLPVVGRPVARRIVRGRVRARAVGDPFDQRRPEVAPRALGGPARGREHGEEVVAVHAQRRDAGADAARGKGRAFAAGDGLEGRDRPLVVDHVQDHRGAIDVGEGQGIVEVGLGGRAVADPARGDLGVALDRRGHRPADRLHELRRQVARDREEARALVRVHHRQLAAADRVTLVAQQLAHQLDDVDVIARQQQALLAIRREAHVARLQGLRVRDRDRLLAQALHVEGNLLLPLRDQHAGVEGARAQHRAQAAPQCLDLDLRRPGADRAARVVEHADQLPGHRAGVGRLDVDRRARHLARCRDPQVGEIGGLPGSAGGLGHVQAKLLRLAGHLAPPWPLGTRPSLILYEVRAGSTCSRLRSSLHGPRSALPPRARMTAAEPAPTRCARSEAARRVRRADVQGANSTLRRHTRT